MADTTQNNAMAEIALALAMGFFSIMVLTMVSMGSAMVTEKVASIDQNQIEVAQNNQDQSDNQKQGDAQAVEAKDMVIFYKGAFLDHKLDALNPTELSSYEKVVLAVHPDSSMNETMKARSLVQNPNLTVVMLNEGWIKALEERS